MLSSGGLWQPGEQGGEAAAQAPELIERLRARLGPEAVQGLRAIEDHRPEAAWATSAIQSGLRNEPVRNAVNPALFDRRPLWLLPKPRLLNERDGLPRRRGPLRLLGEAQRIETGWWDGAEVARDYYSAVDIRGVRLWVFREREPPHQWFLHGVFG
jgi:protein ImuB